MDRTYDYLVASHSLQGKIKNMGGRISTQDHTQGGHFLGRERDRELQAWREQKMPKALPGFSGRKLPGRSKVEEGREEEEEEEEGQEKKMENGVIEEILAGVPKGADAVGAGVTRNAVSVAQSKNDEEDLFSKSGLGVGRKDWLKGDKGKTSTRRRRRSR